MKGASDTQTEEEKRDETHQGLHGKSGSAPCANACPKGDVRICQARERRVAARVYNALLDVLHYYVKGRMGLVANGSSYEIRSGTNEQPVSCGVSRKSAEIKSP